VLELLVETLRATPVVVPLGHLLDIPGCRSPEVPLVHTGSFD